MSKLKYNILTKITRQINEFKHSLKNSEKNTEKKARNYHDIRKLVLYQIGKSPKPLLVTEVEKNIIKDGPAKDKTKETSRYVYAVEKFYFPISLSEYSPSNLLFTSNDFLREHSFTNSNEYHIKIDDEFKNKLKRRLFANYKDYFYCKDENDVRHSIKEVDLNIKDLKCFDENNHPVIEIKIENKKAIINNKSNYIKILINNLGSVKKENIDENTFNIRFYIKSLSADKESALKIYSKMEKYNSKDSSSKKILKIKKLQVSIDNYKPNYIDAPLIHLPKKLDSSKKRPRLKYVLNLRGLIYFLLLCDRKKKRDVRMLNEIIENISASDAYTDLNEEVYRKCVGFKVEQFRGGKLVKEQRKYEPIVPPHKPKIKDRFPFLSFYNDYKNGLPKDFMIDFLFDICFRYRHNLKSKRIYDLKYEVTEEYLKYIRNSLYNPLYSKISYLALEKEQYNALKSLQDEIRTYIDKVKEMTREIEIKNEQFIEKQVKKLEFERKFFNLVSSNEPVISISSIMPSNGYGGYYLTGVERSVIDKFIEYGTEDSESYFFAYPHFLIKINLLKDIYQSISKSNFYDDLKNQLKVYRIPLDCLISVEGWIRDYEDSQFSENYDRLIKMVNKYPKYQIYMTSFLFETSVFNKFFCNRLFSYFI
jgi:hypothetical protein